MPRHTLYAYVDGCDLHDIADDLEARLQHFVEESNWPRSTPWVVNQRGDDGPTLGPGNLPAWELGLNLDLPDPGSEPPGWFSDVERIAEFLGDLHAATGRNFVIGIGDHERRISEDLYFVTTEEPDLELLRKIIGVEDEPS
jgi:hypothetical protein